MGLGGLRRLGRVSAAIAVALTCRAGTAAAQEVPTTFALLSAVIGTTMVF